MEASHTCECGNIWKQRPVAFGAGSKVTCPQCGIEPISIGVNEGIRVAEHTGVIGTQGGEVTMTRSIGTDRQTGADTLDGNVVRSAVSGARSEGEESSILAARTLVERLNEDGANWVHLKDLSGLGAREESGVDAEAEDFEDPSRKLRLQVLRSLHDGRYWTSLNTKGAAAVDRTVDEIVDDIKAAIERKQHARRQGVVLALNAPRYPAMLYRALLRRFAIVTGSGPRASASTRSGWLGPRSR